MICTTSEDCAELLPALDEAQRWALRRYGSAVALRWFWSPQVFAIRGHERLYDDACCPHDSDDGVEPCEACVRVESVCDDAHATCEVR